MPTVTALRPAGPGRVAVDLDGAPWRTVPDDVAVRCALRPGLALDRPRLRHLRGELRRAEALRTAVSALRARDRTVAGLDARLAARGIAAAERTRAVETLERAGLVDDERFAHGRAAALAGRGASDAGIAADLERQGVAAPLVREALEALEPEPDRAARLFAGRGGGVRAVRLLAARGFAEESLEPLVATLGDAAVG